MNENQLKVSNVIKGLMIYILASVGVVIFGIIDTLNSVGDMMSAFASGDASEMFALDTIDVLTILVDFAVIYGIYLYWQALKLFAPVLDTVGANAIKNLAMGALLIMLAAGLDVIGIFIPIVGSVIAGILLLVAFIFNIMGYSSLQGSTALNELGKAGAKQLFLAFIFAIIAAIFGWIPLIGWIIAAVLNVLYWVFLFKGWGKIKESMA